MPTIAATFNAEGRFEKNPFDIYETPYALAKAAAFIMEEDVAYSSFVPGFPATILDPGCGNRGVWGRAFKTVYPDAHITGVELRYLEMAEQHYNEAWFGVDFLSWNPDRKFDMVIGNPPYSSKTDRQLAEKFVRKSMNHLDHDGYLMFLLKMDFAGGVDRFKRLFSEYKPTHIYKSARRVPFFQDTHKNRTNTHEYALYVWNKGKTTYHDTIFRWFEWDEKGVVTLL